MSKRIYEQDLLEIVYGACLMGAGGGGSLENGLQILDSIKAQYPIDLEMISVDEMQSDQFVSTCGGMGSPLKSKERGAACLLEPTYAFKALQNISFSMNRKVCYLMGLEYGAMNTIMPFMVAQKCGIPMLDADGSGRAVPSNETLLYSINNIPITPFVMADPDENITITYPKNCFDTVFIDRLGRHVCQASNMVMGVSFGICGAEDVKEKLVPGAYTKAQLIGKTLFNSKEKNLDVMDELRKVTECKEFFRGRISAFTAESSGGWDFGRVFFKGIGDYEGKKYHIDYQNESLILWEGDTVLMTAPDLICTINLDTYEPMSNADLKEGMNVLVLGMPAHKNWFLTGKGVDIWKDSFNKVGYDGPGKRY